jgi:MFS family permease
LAGTSPPPTNRRLSRLTLSVIIGFGCGLATVTVPLYLAEIAPPNIKKSLGIANQFFIVTGILIGQSLSFPFNQETKWRWVLAVGCSIAVLQLLGSMFVPKVQEVPAEAGDETEPLLPSAGKAPLGILDLFKSSDKAVTRGFALVIITQLAQQLCGISPVMYFSTSILKPIFQDKSKYIALCIVLLKIPITTTPAFLIEVCPSPFYICTSPLTYSASAPSPFY